MASEFKHKVGQGSIFRNERKEKETHADFTGSCNIAGEEYWIAMWQNPPRDGKKGYFNVRFNKKDAVAPVHSDASGISPNNNFDDDVPF